MIFAAARKILNCAMKKAPAPTSRFKSNWSGPHRSGRNDLGNQLRVLPANFQANWTLSLTRESSLPTAGKIGLCRKAALRGVVAIRQMPKEDFGSPTSPTERDLCDF